jgi:hypothetical protein
MLRVVLLASCSLIAAGGLAAAQNAPASPPSAQPAAQDQQSGPDTAPQEANPGESTESSPIFAVTNIELLRSAHTPGLAVIVARGRTSSEGWTDGTLVPLTSGKPIDGVLDLVFVADAPEDASAPATYAPIQAVFPVPDMPFTAVRVRSATNSLTLKDLNGFVEAKAPDDVCGPCVGKTFVAKGAAAPSGVAASDVVHEEDLPANTRILRPTDGISDMRTNPNRLTIVLGEDGRVVDAIWE